MSNIFTSNQVNHAYVVKSVKTSGTLTAADAKGTIKFGTGNEFFQLVNATGNLMRSDLLTNIEYKKATLYSKIGRNLKRNTITLNNAALSSGAPFVGQDYIMTIEMQNPVGMSMDNKYWKQAMVHVTSAINSASEFYKALGKSLVMNFSREAAKLFNFYLELHAEPSAWAVSTSYAVGDLVKVTASSVTTYYRCTSAHTSAGTGTIDTTKFAVVNILVSNSKYYLPANVTTTATVDGVMLEEVANGYRRGVVQDKPLVFSLRGDVVLNSSNNEIEWLVNTPSTGAWVPSGKNAADLEYFSMGERGDLYRGVNFPDNFETLYLVDPTKEYDMINVHYSYVGANHSTQKSEKDVTFICERTNQDSANQFGAVATAIKTALSIS